MTARILMQGSISDRADQDQKHRSSNTIFSPIRIIFLLLKESNDWNYFFEFNYNYMQENRNNYLST